MVNGRWVVGSVVGGSVVGGFNKTQFREKIYRSSRLQLFFKIGALKNFAIFTGKHLYWSLFLIKF